MKTQLTPFAKAVRDFMHEGGSIIKLAEEFEVAPSTAARWAKGVAVPHSRIQEMILDYIKANPPNRPPHVEVARIIELSQNLQTELKKLGPKITSCHAGRDVCIDCSIQEILNAARRLKKVVDDDYLD